jgi:acetate kinase
MLVLVANLGSTSFKFKLLETEADGEVVAQGGYERIGPAGRQLQNS